MPPPLAACARRTCLAALLPALIIAVLGACIPGSTSPAAAASRHRHDAAVSAASNAREAAGGGVRDGASAGPLRFDPVTMLPADQIRPGMRGVARTVFQGTTIEEFPIEVLSVVRHFSSDGDLILVQCHGEKVEHTGVAAGMSGSPVYLNGKLAGAIAMAWPFSKDAIAGVTPIEQMIRVTQVSDSARQLEFEPQLPSPTDRMAPVPLLFGISGHSRNLPILADSLLAGLGVHVVDGGQLTHSRMEGLSTDLVPGAAVAVNLVSGDLDLAAVGTVTYRQGDQLLAFGHPLFSLGAVSLPMSTAYIHTILSSEMSSSKVASTGDVVGALTEDRAYAIRGAMGGRADQVPVTLDLRDESGQRRSFHYYVMRHASFTANLTGVALVDGLSASAGSLPRVALPFDATIFFGGGRRFAWHDQPTSAAGAQPSVDLARDVATRVNLLLNNTWSPVAVDSIVVHAQVLPGSHTATLESAWLLQGRAHPGDPVGVAVRVKPDRGESYVETIRLQLPTPMPAGRYRVLVGDSDSRLDAEKTRAPGLFRPSNLNQALELYDLKGSRAAIYAAVYSEDVGASARGAELPGLPGSTLAALDDGRLNGGVQWVKARRWADATQPVSSTVTGSFELNLKVESEGP